MSIRAVPTIIKSTSSPGVKYLASDNTEFFNIDEAIEYENSLVKEPDEPVVYEQIFTIQQAINMAVEEKRIVRFLWEGDNKAIKKSIVDIKGCKLMKSDKESRDIAIIPPSIDKNTFDFGEVK